MWCEGSPTRFGTTLVATTRHRVALLLTVVLGGVAFTCGCGASTGGRVAISGKVSFRGTPLTNGTIEFVSKDRTILSGSGITDGKYSIPAAKGLKPGPYTVRISSTKVEGPAPPPGPPGPEAMAQKITELIPAEYNTNSTLTAEVPTGGSDKLNFDLK